LPNSEPHSSMNMKYLIEAIEEANRVYLIGNGGSAANAIHIANDLMLKGIKAQALLDIATVTAFANDFGYEHIFSRQIDIHGQEGDLLIALSGSGNSPNVLNAIWKAKEKGMRCISIIGGGKAQEISEYILTDPNMQKSEQRQLEIGHEVYLSL